jgi:hypothetical protein
MMQRKTFSSIIIGSFFCLNLSSQGIDSIACKKVEDTLKVVEFFLDDINSDPQLKRITAIAFLLELSKIPYEGGVTFIGTEFPARSFYTKCKDWYIVNKRKLVWDVKENKVIVRD